MSIRTEQDIEQIVRDDSSMMRILEAAETLGLSDWWIGAGFLRNKIWDTMEGNTPKQPRDIDLVYFNAQDVTPETDWAYDAAMHEKYPFAEWEVRNQARMHYVNGFDPYSSTAEGIAHWVETATCIGIRLEQGRLSFLWCHGMDDVIHLIARPTKYFRTKELLPTFYKRITEKGWRERWPNLQVIEE